MSIDDILSKNIEKLEEEKKGSMSFSSYLEKVSEKPSYGSHAAKYIVGAIESAGTRDIIEEGEVKERYNFFDDPYNNGKNAVLGNTDELNSFVEDIKKMAEGTGSLDKMLWVVGPTATGKSELKRCIVNGLERYSQTEEGKRYTLAWSTDEESNIGPIGFGTKTKIYEEKGEWVKSPVQENPLKLLYSDIREEYLSRVEEEKNEELLVEGDLSPFDRKFLEEKGKEGYSDLFDSKDELKVVDYVVERGHGIGILQSEEEGTPKQRMVGAWKGDPSDIRKYGRGDPRVFEYSGVFSQGNNGLTILEDVVQHKDVLQKLLNIPEEKQVEIGDAMNMDLDTVIMLISNPDLEYNLSKSQELQEKDPFRALKRRMKKHEFRYLTNYSLETELLRREISSEYRVWEYEDERDKQDKIAKPLLMEVGDKKVEIAPHTLEAAAMYNIITRLEDDMELSEDVEGVENDFTVVDKAILFDRGFLKRGLKKLDKDCFEFGEKEDGKTGVPVTYTREKLLEKIEKKGGKHSDVLMPSEIIEFLSDVENLSKSSVSEKEVSEYKNKKDIVERYVIEKQEEDVLEALLHDMKPSEIEIVNYVESVAEWYEEDDGEEVNDVFMRTFEMEELEMFNEEDYKGVEPSEEVEQFREKEIYDGIRKLAREKEDDFVFSDHVTEIEVLKEKVVENSWSTVFRKWENFDPNRWRSPPGGTDTKEVKSKAINNMIDMLGYSEESAELASYHVISEIIGDLQSKTSSDIRINWE